MKAETAYQVIQALPEKEVNRLFQMLGVQTLVSQKTKASKKKPLLSDAEATEYLLKKLKKFI